MKSKAWKRWLGVVLAAGILAGCGGASEDAASGAAGETGSAAETAAEAGEEQQVSGEKMVISISSWDLQEQFGAENAANDTIYHEMSDKLGIEIDPITVTWNDWTEKNNVWAASGQLPDMFAASVSTDNPSLYRKWARQGILKALPDDLSAYPNLEKLMQMEAVQPLKVDGKFYTIPRMTYEDSDSWVMDRLIVYRKDWAAEAGWTEKPKTYDEFVQMCRDVKALKQDKVALCVNNLDYLMYLGTDILPQYCNGTAWVYENEKWVPCVASEKVPQIFERFQNLYAEGILDPDIATLKEGDSANKFYSGQAFALVMNVPTVDQLEQLKETDSTVTDVNESVGMIGSFTAEDGNNYYYSNMPYWSDMLISAAVDDEKLAKCLELMDYMLSDEFKSMKNNGIEGVDWEMKDGVPTLLLENQSELMEKYPISYSGYFGYFAAWDNDYPYSGKKVVDTNPEFARFDQTKVEMYQNGKENEVAAPINFDIILMENEQMNNISNITTCHEEYMVQAVIGSESAETCYQNMINEMNGLGLQEMTDSVTAQAAEEGIEP